MAKAATADASASSGVVATHLVVLVLAAEAGAACLRGCPPLVRSPGGAGSGQSWYPLAPTPTMVRGRLAAPLPSGVNWTTMVLSSTTLDLRV